MFGGIYMGDEYLAGIPLYPGPPTSLKNKEFSTGAGIVGTVVSESRLVSKGVSLNPTLNPVGIQIKGTQ